MLHVKGGPCRQLYIKDLKLAKRVDNHTGFDYNEKIRPQATHLTSIKYAQLEPASSNTGIHKRHRRRLNAEPAAKQARCPFLLRGHRGRPRRELPHYDRPVRHRGYRTDGSAAIFWALPPPPLRQRAVPPEAAILAAALASAALRHLLPSLVWLAAAAAAAAGR